MKIVGWIAAVCFVMLVSSSARAQINPKYQVSLPATIPAMTSGSTAAAVSSDDLQGATADDDSEVAAQQSSGSPGTPQSSSSSSSPNAGTAQTPPQANWPPGAPLVDAYGKPYKHISQVYYHEWSWETGVYAGGGTGLGSSHSTQFFLMGIQAGKVLTEDHLPSIFRGNFEYGGEIIPVYELFTINTSSAPVNVYGVSVKPIVLRWNLTSFNKFVPFFQLAGGFLITNGPVPPGHTSAVNFTPQGGFGFNVFTKPGQAVKTEFIFGHISNANLGVRNPGYNSLFLFEFGYEWLHGWRHH